MIKDIMTANELVTPTQKEINVLKENFPSCFSADGTFDVIRFSEFLKDKVDISHEGYELKFLGKNYAKMLASLDTETVIVPDEAHNSLPENANSENVYISGDNLDGLKHLLKSYAGQVKCIYIDPPYNTGSDGFVYNDKFNFTAEDLTVKLSIDETQANHIIDMTTHGRASHSAWLTFMLPRLQLARDLLDKDGVIFISIDDNEVSDLRLLCDDIFGAENFISCLSIENNPKGRKNSDFIAVSSEYCLIYSKNKDVAHFIENVPKAASDMTLDENGNYVHNSGKRVLVGENCFNNLVTNVESDKNYSVYYKKETNGLVIRKDNIGEVDNELLAAGYIRYASVREGLLIENTYTEKKFIELFENDVIEDSGVSYSVKRSIPYNEFLKRISQQTSIPIRELHKAMCELSKEKDIPDEYINEYSVANIVSAFTDWRIEKMQMRFKYKRSAQPVTETALTYKDGSPRDVIKQGIVGTKFVEGTPSDKYLYDKIVFDSPLEKTNITTDIDEVVVYGKIPKSSVAIPTIVGENYSPDFMYVVKHKDGTKELNIVVETKLVENKSTLREIEDAKIKCAEAFFKQLTIDGYTVSFHTQLSNKKVKQIIDDVIADKGGTSV